MHRFCLFSFFVFLSGNLLAGGKAYRACYDPASLSIHKVPTSSYHYLRSNGQVVLTTDWGSVDSLNRHRHHAEQNGLLLCVHFNAKLINSVQDLSKALSFSGKPILAKEGTQPGGDIQSSEYYYLDPTALTVDEVSHRFFWKRYVISNYFRKTPFYIAKHLEGPFLSMRQEANVKVHRFAIPFSLLKDRIVYIKDPETLKTYFQKTVPKGEVVRPPPYNPEHERKDET